MFFFRFVLPGASRIGIVDRHIGVHAFRYEAPLQRRPVSGLIIWIFHLVGVNTGAGSLDVSVTVVNTDDHWLAAGVRINKNS